MRVISWCFSDNVETEEFKNLGIVETAGGLEYHPIHVSEPRSKEKKSQVKRNGSNSEELKKRKKETVRFGQGNDG